MNRITILPAFLFLGLLFVAAVYDTAHHHEEPLTISRVCFAGVWYDYYGNHIRGALYVHGSRVPFAFLSHSRITRNGTDELIGDLAGLRFERQ